MSSVSLLLSGISRLSFDLLSESQGCHLICCLESQICCLGISGLSFDLLSGISGLSFDCLFSATSPSCSSPAALPVWCKIILMVHSA